MKKGFTLVELMIVVAIIAILAAIAIPNLIQSRAQANEASAIASCKAYFSSQVLFQRAGFAAYELVGPNAITATSYVNTYVSDMYAAPYMALYATNDGSGKPISLINSGMVAGRITGSPLCIVTEAPDRFGVSTGGGAGGGPTTVGVSIKLEPAVDLPTFSAYQGYVFADDFTRGETYHDWRLGFSFFATPKNWSITGYNTFWVSQSGVVYSRNLRVNNVDFDALKKTIGTASVEADISKGSNTWQMTK